MPVAARPPDRKPALSGCAAARWWRPDGKEGHAAAMLLPPALILLVGCAMVGCTATGTEKASPRSTSPRLAASAGTDAASEPSVAPSPQPDAGYASCDDRDGDGGELELSGVQVDRDGSTLKILWVLGGEVPTQGPARYTLDAANEDGTASQQFVVGYQDGKQVEYYARDMTTGRRTAVTGEADIDDSFLISAFPAGGLKEKFNYSVAGLLGELVADRCPDDAESLLYDR